MIPLQQVEVLRTHPRIQGQDGVDCETHHGIVDQIDKHIEFTGKLLPGQGEYWLDLAKRCPVHPTLLKHVRIHDP